MQKEFDERVMHIIEKENYERKVRESLDSYGISWDADDKNSGASTHNSDKYGQE